MTIRRTVCWVFTITAAFGAVSMNAGTAENGRLLKGNARYCVRPEYSRFLLLFKGNVRYDGSTNGNILTVHITGIQSAVSQNAAHLQFHQGLVQGATVDRIVDGKTTVTLTLRENNRTYKISANDRHDAVWIDVFPKDDPVAAHSQMPKRSSRIPERAARQRSAGKTPIVDIPELIRDQLSTSESSKGNAGRPNEQHATPDGNNRGDESNRPSTTPSSRWLLVISLSLVTPGILGIVYLIRHRRKDVAWKNNSSPVSVQPASSPSSVDLRTVEEGMGEMHTVERESEVEPDKTADDVFGNRGEEFAVALAMQYRRNRGDVEFALKLRETGMAHSDGSARDNAASRFLIKGSRWSAAKRLGVGWGELELADRLKKMEAEQKQQETV